MAVSTRRGESAVIPTAVSIAAGLLTFLLLVREFESARAAALAAGAAALVTALFFGAWALWLRRRAISRQLSGPVLGQIPLEPTVSRLSAKDTAAAQAYEVTAAELEAQTTGQVVLVTSPSPGQGTSRTALNLAAAATRSGRRAVLVDGDPTQNGLSRFGRTGATPGLAELARGEADLAAASRLWAIAGDFRLPFIPAGDGDLPVASGNGSEEMANAVDMLTSVADLILIDVPPLGWNSSAQSLATHADGSVLVVTETSDPDAITGATRSLADVGAPVIGYVVNGAQAQLLHPTPLWRRIFWRALITTIVAALLFVGWNAFRIWDSWQSVERDELDVGSAQVILPIPETGITTPEVFPEQAATAVTSAPVDEAAFRSFLIVGSDEGGHRADVIILTLFPEGSDKPLMISLPRDLYLPNRCGSTYTRVNATLAGCGSSVNGPTLLALTVEDYTGIPVDHFALFDFDGFERILDAVGGVEVCVDRPVRDIKAFLDLPAGCTNATGEQALAWVRSRSTEELVDGVWRTMPGVNDLTRNEKQQDVILAMLAKLKSFDSPSQLSGVADAISLAWSLRTLDIGEITRISIPVRDFRTEDDALVLVPTVSFADLLSDERPELLLDAA
jgi:LCP family protein required for cell wall assembly